MVQKEKTRFNTRDVVARHLMRVKEKAEYISRWEFRIGRKTIEAEMKKLGINETVEKSKDYHKWATIKANVIEAYIKKLGSNEAVEKSKDYDKWATIKADVKTFLLIIAYALVPFITTFVVVCLMFFSDLEPLWGWIAALVVAFGTLMIMIKR